MSDLSTRQRRALWAFRFFIGGSSAQFNRGVFLIYLAARGHSLFQLGLFEGCFWTARLLADLPLGAVADRVGRRMTISFGLLASAAGAVLMLAGPVWLLVIAFALMGTGYAGQRGADSALLYELLSDADQKDRYAKETGRAWAMGFGVLALCTAVGGVMYQWSHQLPFYAQGVACAATVWFVWRVPEAARSSASRGASIGRTMLLGWQALRGRRVLLNMILFSSLVTGGVTAVSIFSQNYFAKLGIHPAVVSVIIGFGTLLASGISMVAYKLKALGVTWAMLASATMFTAGLAFMYSGVQAPAVIGFYFVYLTIDLVYPVLGQYVNDTTADEIRSTVLSFGGLAGSIVTIPAFVLTGAIASDEGYSWVFIGLLLISLPLFALPILGRKQVRQPALATEADS